MDVTTLFILNTVSVGFVGSALLFFRSQQKTYPGFGRWTAGAWLLFLTYGLIVIRGQIQGPALWLSIFVVNTAVCLAALVRLDGTAVFLTDRAMPRLMYTLAPLVGLGAVALDILWGDVSLGFRGLLNSLVIIYCAVRAGGLFMFQGRPSGRVLYRVLGLFYLFFCVVFIFRAWDMLANPSVRLMSQDAAQQIYLASVMIIEIGWSLGFLMANSQRLEADLRRTQVYLTRSAGELRAALEEVKTLSGLLPICSHCKRIRDDQGYWQRIENYIESHTDAEFTHGLCPDCVAELYPQLALDDEIKD